jgi:hypothetical protein
MSDYNTILGLPPFTGQKTTGYPGYSSIILRPFDSVHVPRDIKRSIDGSVEKEYKCDWPAYAGSKYQQWCSEKNAVMYHAMRPIMSPDDYTRALYKLFKVITGPNQSRVPKGDWKKGLVPKDSKALVFCGLSSKEIMDFLMLKINSDVPKVPELMKNGSWISEQFYWAEPATFYYFIDPSGREFYNILFYLYNPLRSISTMVQAIITPATNNDFVIVFMDIINSKMWRTDGRPGTDTVEGIEPFTPGPSGPSGIDLSGTSHVFGMSQGAPYSELPWIFGDKVLKQEFNEHGFYDPGNTVNGIHQVSSNNVNIQGGVPDSLKAQIKTFEKNSPSYLIPSATNSYNGYNESIPFSGINSKESSPGTSGMPINVLNGPVPFYEIPMDLNKNGLMNVKKVPVTKAVGFVRQ